MSNDRKASRNPRRGMEQSGDPLPDFVDQVMSLVQSIPPGYVMTYGDIAIVLTARSERAGLTESYGPRMVGFVMSRFGSTLPWWRVIRSTGHPPRFHHERAWPHYQDEGTPLVGPADSYRIDLKRARFLPEWEDGPPDQGVS